MNGSDFYNAIPKRSLGIETSEIISQPLYDYLTFGQNDHEAVFFREPRSVQKTLADTNLDLPYSLPVGQAFMIESIEVQAPYEFGEGASLELYIGACRYLAIPASWAISRPHAISTKLCIPAQRLFDVRIARRIAPEKPTRVGVILHGDLMRVVT